MKTFSLTELSNKSGEIIEAAQRGPVNLTRRGKRKYVLIAADLYDQMVAKDERRVVRAKDLTPAEAEHYIHLLSQPLEEPDSADD